MIKRILEWTLIGGLIRMVFRLGFYFIVAGAIYMWLSGRGVSGTFGEIAHAIEGGIERLGQRGGSS